ncbi:NAD(P)-dependent oxidoreductase [Streptococcus sp. 121]|uniref:NAD(P)-dependent oxidoreductase n=1 Tax=Streptococcus sp. 121 TaxID=2797637 RepID=UPI0018F08FBD|nr:NAD(P)-dependent oxidoreductase [Streptococcus sp. 121]MBJ6746596.1 NAD(P)-dependent oxidoreductase [Streptococcus sp. 121]
MEIYNIGNNKLNYNLTSIAKIISDEVGNVPINFDGDKEDNRNYKVNFDKIERIGFVTEKSIRDGVEEIKESIIQREILNPYDAKYSNVKIAKNDYL